MQKLLLFGWLGAIAIAVFYFAVFYSVWPPGTIGWSPRHEALQVTARPLPAQPVTQDPVNQPVSSPPLDPAAVRVGEVLFRHEWTPNDPLASGGDGLGPVHNATSCAACHFQNGIGGSGGLAQNVTTFTQVRERVLHGTDSIRGTPVNIVQFELIRQGVLHNHSTLGRDETLRDIGPDLPAVARPTLAELLRADPAERLRLGAMLPVGQPSLNLVVSTVAATEDSGIRFPKGVHVSQRNTVALFGAKLIVCVRRIAFLTAVV
jgi:mono/diheme cytochrome c family protein